MLLERSQQSERLKIPGRGHPGRRKTQKDSSVPTVLPGEGSTHLPLVHISLVHSLILTLLVGRLLSPHHRQKVTPPLITWLQEVLRAQIILSPKPGSCCCTCSSMKVTHPLPSGAAGAGSEASRVQASWARTRGGQPQPNSSAPGDQEESKCLAVSKQGDRAVAP